MFVRLRGTAHEFISKAFAVSLCEDELIVM